MAIIREAYLERRLMYRANGEMVPIGGTAGTSERWLQPTFPLDWHTDLIEVLDFVAHAGPPDVRMQPAIDASPRHSCRTAHGRCATPSVRRSSRPGASQPPPGQPHDHHARGRRPVRLRRPRAMSDHLAARSG